MDIQDRATDHLRYLCTTLPERRVGSQGNRKATDYVAAALRTFGFAVSLPDFVCTDWQHGPVSLTTEDGARFSVQIGPYSLGANVRGPLLTAGTEADLATLDARNALLLLYGDLTCEQLMPKAFPFYNPEHHRRILALLEAKAPAAILAATDRDPGLAGGISPFPLIEDGDFDIPSAYMTVEEGARLAAYAGRTLHLQMDATRTPAVGCNVIGRKGRSAERLVFCAHVDAKDNTPGALDNAAGVIVLLLLAELLQHYGDELTIEFVFFNGEDYYSAPGETLYVAQNAGKFEEIIAAVNIDGAGYRDGKSAFSLFNCPPPIDAALRRAFAGPPAMTEGPAWYQSDHTVFIQQGRPAAAITSAAFLDELTVNITHTPADRPELVDAAKLAAIAHALVAFVQEMAAGPTA